MADESLQDGLPGITLRTALRAGDVETVARMHGELYGREYGFDGSFEAYVREPLSVFAAGPGARGRMWLAEREGGVVGSVAIVEVSGEEAMVRWFLVHPSARGRGLGRRLMGEAISFCVACGYGSVSLWTVAALTTAVRLYRGVGFERVFFEAARHWGVDVVAEKYVLALAEGGRRREAGAP